MELKLPLAGIRIEEIRRQNLFWIINHEFGGLSVNLSKALDLQPSQISRVFNSNPKNHRNVGRNLAKRIEELTGRPDGWMDLIHDFVDYSTTDQRPKQAARGPKPAAGSSNVQPFDCQLRPVPIIPWDMAEAWTLNNGGIGMLAQEKLLCPVPCSTKTFAMRVRGVTMEPLFNEQEYIFVDPDRKPEHGRFVVAKSSKHSQVMLRQLIVEAGRLYLKASNPTWPTPFVDLDENTRILGVVIFKGEPV